jgi:2-polyprenyl-6-hydroxyphenyl methylase/3-demethylubiquinone-9 3-methyltransferase
MHIKFFSMATLGSLLQAAGFEVLEWKRFGRIPALARSMMAITRRPLH